MSSTMGGLRVNGIGGGAAFQVNQPDPKDTFQAVANGSLF
jgi:hypothetical protein